MMFFTVLLFLLVIALGIIFVLDIGVEKLKKEARRSNEQKKEEKPTERQTVRRPPVAKGRDFNLEEKRARYSYEKHQESYSSHSSRNQTDDLIPTLLIMDALMPDSNPEPTSSYEPTECPSSTSYSSTQSDNESSSSYSSYDSSSSYSSDSCSSSSSDYGSSSSDW